MSPEARRTRLLTSAVHSEARRALRGNGKQTGQSLRHDPDGSSPVSCPRDRKDRKEDRHRVSKAPLGRCCGASTWALYTAPLSAVVVRAGMGGDAIATLLFRHMSSFLAKSQ
uniref:Uncharacterized protein n=1 Tax=Plectus sambesii TaxID=2011161 RepID=A0A914X709_9BILA